MADAAPLTAEWLDDAIDALSHAIGMAAMLRTESVVLQAPAARHVIEVLRSLRASGSPTDAALTVETLRTLVDEHVSKPNDRKWLMRAIEEAIR